MKKVTGGKMYNTETATIIGTWDNGCFSGDFNACKETLYRTKKDNYFLHGKGGAMSSYSKSCGQNTWCGGEEIIPMSPSEAQEWAERKLSGEEVEKIFSASIEEA